MTPMWAEAMVPVVAAAWLYMMARLRASTDSGQAVTAFVMMCVTSLIVWDLVFIAIGAEPVWHGLFHRWTGEP